MTIESLSVFEVLDFCNRNDYAELPLAFDEISLPAEKMDVMRIHIDTLIDEIIRN